MSVSWQAPSSGFRPPEQGIEIGVRYLMEVRSIEDMGEETNPQYIKNGKPHRKLLWKWRMCREDDRNTLTDVEGAEYLFWEWTSNKLGKGKGKTAKAREIMEAIYQRELTDQEAHAIDPEQLVGGLVVVIFTDPEEEGDKPVIFSRKAWREATENPAPQSAPPPPPKRGAFAA